MTTFIFLSLHTKIPYNTTLKVLKELRSFCFDHGASKFLAVHYEVSEKINLKNIC